LNVTEGTHCSRVDNWLFLSSPELGISETVFPTRTQVKSEVPLTSDHHPVVLTVDRSQIPIMDTSYDPTAKPNVVIRRMKQNVPQDMLSSLRDTLSNEIREDIESLSQTVTSAHREHHANGKAVIRNISGKVDTLLAKAWEITLREVGETVSMGATHPPIKGRSNQSGHLKNTSKRKYLLKHLQKVRTTIKEINKITHSTPTAEHISKIHKILQNPPPTDTTTPAEAWEALQQNLSETRVSLKRVLTKHNRERTLTKLIRLQRLLHENPKKAHRWIFEGGESKKLDSVRLATGEIDSSEEGVKREVTRIYTERSTPVVPRETAGEYPREHPQREKPLILNSGGTHDRLGNRYTKHVYQDWLGRLPGRKAPGPDGDPNEVLKNLLAEFHEAVHGLFQTNVCGHTNALPHNGRTTTPSYSTRRVTRQ
jgi:hypothetical protein